MMRDLYAIKNHSDSETFLVKPSEFDSKMPEDIRSNKTKRGTWSKSPKTEHCFFNGFEGEDPYNRPHKLHNPIAKCLAIVADYDCKKKDIKAVAKEILEQSTDDMPYPPYEICETGSGGVRAIWYPEASIPMNNETAKLFMKQMAKELHMHEMVAGIDVPALSDPSKTYEVGQKWIQINTQPLPSVFCSTMLLKATKNYRYGSSIECDVPLSRAESLLRKKYPQVDFPRFEIHTRLKRFWDESATDETGAVIVSGGIYCHSGDEMYKFKPWGDELLLGAKAMREFEQDRTGYLLEKYWYDGKKYISFNEEMNIWRIQSESSMKLSLSSHHGLNPKVPKGAVSSERENMMERIQTRKTVHGAAHFIFMKQGPIEFNGDQFINISQVKPMEPSGKSGKWGKHFPFMAEFLDNFFITPFQKDIFLAWLKTFYESARAFDPVQGQAMFIAGPTSCGKTLLNFHILKPIMGGGKDASQYYVEGNQFAEGFYTHGLHLVDDAAQGGRKWEQSKMAARYKRTVASPEISVEDKGDKRKQIKWLGRVCTTMNNDPDSMKTMPELQETLEDKVIILRAKVPGDLLKKRFKQPVPVIEKELQHFLQWLVDWELPAHVIDEENPRFIVKSICDGQLKQVMREGSDEENFADILQEFLTEYSLSENGKKKDGSNKTSEVFVLTPLRNALLNFEAYDREITRDYCRGPQKFSNMLKELNRRGYHCERVRSRGKTGVKWKFDFDLKPTPEEEEEEDE